MIVGIHNKGIFSFTFYIYLFPRIERSLSKQLLVYIWKLLIMNRNIQKNSVSIIRIVLQRPFYGVSRVEEHGKRTLGEFWENF